MPRDGGGRARWSTGNELSYSTAPPCLIDEATADEGTVTFQGGLLELSFPYKSNRASADEVLLERFGEGTRIKHRWWFPETYRGLTTGKFLSGLVDRDTWRSARDYFLFREVGTPLGSEDAFVYFAREFDGEFKPAN